jgi:ketosteroid isomerase-like protein
MSQADIETLRITYEALSRKDWDAAFRQTHPDFELITHGGRTGLLGGTYRGRDAVSRFFEDQWEAFEVAVVEPQEFYEAPRDRIVAFALSRFRPKDSSAVLETRTAQLWTMRGGKVARCELFPAREEALEAAGLSE